MTQKILVLRNGRIITTEMEIPAEGSVDIFIRDTDDKFGSKLEKVTVSLSDVLLQTQNMEHATFASDIVRGVETTLDGIKKVLLDRVPDVVELEIKRGPWRGQFQYGAYMPTDMLVWGTTLYRSSFKSNNIFDIDLELNDASHTDVAIIQIEHFGLKPLVVELPKLIERQDGSTCHEVLAIFGEDKDGRLHAWNGNFPKECLYEYLLHEGYGEYVKEKHKVVSLTSLEDLYEKYGAQGDDMVDAVNEPSCDAQEIIAILKAREKREPSKRSTPSLG